MKRFVALFLGVLMVGGLLAPSAIAENAAVEIEFWHQYASGTAAEHITTLLNKFMEENPNVKVKDLGIAFGDYDNKLLPALTAGTGPDICMGDLGNPKARAESGVIMNLAPYVRDSGFDTSLYLPAAVEQCTYQGDLYALPFITDTRVLYWNKDHFTAAGLDPETPPASWAELIAMNEKLKVVSEGDPNRIERIGFSTRIGDAFPWTIGWTFGANLFDENHMPTFNTPELRDGLNMALTIQDQVGLSAFDAFNEGTKALGFSPFIGEAVSMIMATNTLYGQIKQYNPDLNFGVALIPTNDGQHNKSSWGNGYSLEICYKGDDAKAKAAFDLGAFLVRTDNALSFIENQSEFVCNVEALKNPKLMADPIWATMVASGEVTQFRPFIQEYPTWYMDLMPEWDSALRHEKTPEEALTAAESAVKQEIENYRMMNGQ